MHDSRWTRDSMSELFFRSKKSHGNLYSVVSWRRLNRQTILLFSATWFSDDDRASVEPLFFLSYFPKVFQPGKNLFPEAVCLDAWVNANNYVIFEQFVNSASLFTLFPCSLYFLDFIQSVWIVYWQRMIDDSCSHICYCLTTLVRDTDNKLIL